MTNTLAADAADVELTRDPAPFIEDVLRDAANGDGDPNPLAVRDALLELARLEREVDEVAQLKAQIVERYDDTIKKRQGRAAALRDSLHVYALRFGKASFPDVGGIHLTTRRAKARPVDAVAFQAWLETNGAQTIVEAATETVIRFDAGRALELYLDHVDAEVKPDGCIVDREGGIYELDGVEVVPESKTLAVRKS